MFRVPGQRTPHYALLRTLPLSLNPRQRIYRFLSPMATPNCSTYGQSNCSRQNVADYDYSGVTAMRAAASFRR